jgi:putative hydrolase of the HAD superfamily
MYRAFGFDLDNTLYDQSQHLHSFFREAGRWLAERSAMPAAEIERAFVCEWKRRTMACPNLFDEALRELGLWRPDWVRELVRKYRAHRCPLMLYDGAQLLLERLARNYPLFLITDGHGSLQRFKVEQLGISSLFRAILFTDDYGPGWSKPAPYAFTRAAALLDVPVSSCLFTGDDPHCDVEGARRAGMATARVLNGPYRYRPCVAPPDLTVRHAGELEEALEKLNLVEVVES